MGECAPSLGLSLPPYELGRCKCPQVSSEPALQQTLFQENLGKQWEVHRETWPNLLACDLGNVPFLFIPSGRLKAANGARLTTLVTANFATPFTHPIAIPASGSLTMPDV